MVSGVIFLLYCHYFYPCNILLCSTEGMNAAVSGGLSLSGGGALTNRNVKCTYAVLKCSLLRL